MNPPRRILALSGGGVRGIVEVAFLEAIEAEYSRRNGPGRIYDWFDLIGGTSTGALIATALALGKPLEEIRDFYLDRAVTFFSRRRWFGLPVGPIFDSTALEAEIRRDVGTIALDDPAFRTRLAIVSKRLDTGSSWIVSNIPTAPFWNHGAGDRWVGNRHYDVARLLRAASAAPTLFSPQEIDIVEGAAAGVFIDGGISTYNDPALALLRLARLKAFGLEWPLGPDRLFILSLGTGRFRRRLSPAQLRNAPALVTALRALTGMISDAEQASLTMMEWLGTSPAPSRIDSEIGTLDGEFLAGVPLFTYLRLDLPLEAPDLAAAGLGRSPADLRLLRSLDRPEAIRPLYDLTREWAARSLKLADWLR